MATVNFLYRSQKKESDLKLRLLFTNEKPKVIETRSKIYVDKTNWDKITTSKRLRDAELLDLKTEIDEKTNDLRKYILDSFRNSFIGDIDKKWLENQVSKYYKSKESKYSDTPVENSQLLKNWIEKYIEYRKGDITDSTYRKQTSMKNNIIRFLEAQTAPIYLSDINFDFKKQFESYFDEEMYSINTTARMLKFVKTVCKFGELNGIKLSNQFNSIKNRKEKTQSFYLTPQEQSNIEKLTLNDEELKVARDWLIISCSTGQRHSDYSRFDSSMIREVKGKKIIEFTQQKVNKKIAVLLNDKVLNILKKYDNQFPPTLHEQVLNKKFKDLGEIAEINEMLEGKIKKKTKKGLRNVEGVYPKYMYIGTHIGRYSFANNNYGKLPTAYIRRVTGHATEEALLEYIGKSDVDLALIEGLY